MTTTPQIPNRKEPAGMPCADASGLLPWLLNGSLEGAERRRLREHLAACESCRRELGETAEVWRLATRHVPSLSLAEYSQGLTPSEIGREQIERHLAVCPSCREEAELAAAGEALDFESARERRAEPSRLPVSGSGDRGVRPRLLALAATVALVAAGGLLWSRAERPETAPGNSAVPPHSVTARAGERPAGQDPSGAVLFFDGFESGTTAAWAPSAARLDPSQEPEPTNQVPPKV